MVYFVLFIILERKEVLFEVLEEIIKRVLKFRVVRL